MNSIVVFLKNLISAWPSILMGAIIPALTLGLLFFSKKRKTTAFKAVVYGAATFFASLAIVAVLILSLAQFFMPVITTSQASSANSYIFTFGIIVLLLFYGSSEALKQFSFRHVIKTEKTEFAGLTFGCGFILAQNLLIVGLIYAGEVDKLQMVVFGILMVICGVIYLLNSNLCYTLTCEGNWATGSATAISYYLILAVMLLFANTYVAYITVGLVLAFNLIATYYIRSQRLNKGGSK